MKANQAFKNNDEAVSPVIGVILMVAITVVLAAVVFVLVTRLAGNQEDQAPSISFNRVDTTTGLGGSLTVVSVQGGTVTWADICVKDSTGAIVGTATGATNCTGGADNTNCVLPPAAQDVEAGDVIMCNGAGVTTETDGPFTIYHDSTGSVFYTAQFHT